MDVRVERTVDRPFWRLEPLVVAGAREWVPCLEEYPDGRVLTEIGVGSGAGWLGRRVVLQVGAPATWPGRCEVPLSWRADQRPELFPVFAGVLELATVTPERTLAALEGGYTPPGGVVGEVTDRAVLHRVAEASLRTFLARVVWVLEQRAGTAPAS